MIEWIFFDVGETLINEERCYTKHFEKCCNSLNNLGIHTTTLEYRQMVENCYLSNIENPLDTVWNSFNSNEKRPSWSHEHEKIQNSTYHVLEQLSAQYNLGIIANQSSGLSKRLRHYDIEKFFKVIVSSSDVGIEKPHLDIFKIAMKEANVCPKNSMYVGDRIDNDIVPSKKLKMQTVRIKQGLGKLHKEHPDYQSDFIINDIEELLLLLKIK